MTGMTTVPASDLNSEVESITTALCAAGKDFYRRGWVLGTSGNFSAVFGRDPLKILVTASGVSKGRLGLDQFVAVDLEGSVVGGCRRPSAETLLHTVIYRERPGVGAVLHTHSVWSTVLSGRFASRGGMLITGFEMLKGLSGAVDHEHKEWLPILENSQSYPELSRKVADTLAKFPAIHGFLLTRHGLYTWGRDVDEAQRHLEILEFLVEVIGREEQRTDEPQRGNT